MGRLFGTDGVRGVANLELTADLAYRLGRAGAYTLAQGRPGSFLVVGKDTRISGDMLESALIAGICSVGVDVKRLGVLPTPGVAFLTRALGAAGGVVISASHNPVEDNGIKFFAGDGFKLPDEVESEVENLVEHNQSLPFPVGGDIGRILPQEDTSSLYINHLKKVAGRNFPGLRVVVDCANGAACQIAPRLWQELGAEVVAINHHPDGININVNSGSTHPEGLARAVVAHRAHLGLAHDGDADRVIAVDEKGQVVDGDRIMVICALGLKERGELKGNGLVVTVMSNLGLHQALARHGIQVVETKVGDRYVLEEMRQRGYLLGGEQSGHIIFLEHNTTGDGLITGVQLAAAMVDQGQPLSQMAARMQCLPQVLVNVRVKDKEEALKHPALARAVEKAQQQLNGQGRILIRPSGTEPLIRIMAEGPDQPSLETLVDQLALVVNSL